MVEKIQLFPSNRRISCATPSRQRKNPTNSFSIPIVGICYRLRTSDKKPQPFSKKTPDPHARPAHLSFVDKLLGFCCTLRSSKGLRIMKLFPRALLSAKSLAGSFDRLTRLLLGFLESSFALKKIYPAKAQHAEINIFLLV